MIEVTKELIESIKSDRGGFTKVNLKKIGVEWPLTSGWKQRAIGTFVPEFVMNSKLTFIPVIDSESESGLTFRFEMTPFKLSKMASTKKPSKPNRP